MKITCPKKITPPAGSIPSGAKAPLLKAQAMRKLPIGSVRAGGWLGHQLDLMVEGMVGRLSEISEFLQEENGWFKAGHYGWEEQPYWLRGAYRLAVLTGSERLLAQAALWMEHVLRSQDEEGYFGPRGLRKVRLESGHELVDLWAHMVMLDVLTIHFEHTADPRVIPFMSRFFDFCANIPEEQFIPSPSFSKRGPLQFGWGDKSYVTFVNQHLGKGSSRWFVQWPRAGEMLPSIYWLYEQTGDAALLPLASRFYRHTMPPIGEWLHDHVVNFTQRFRYPGNYYLQTGENWYFRQTEYWYRQHMETWGQQPRGALAADERIRPGRVDPRQAIETCGMVEFQKSFTILGRIEGDPVYADRCEDIMFNHFPAAQTPDHRGVRYLTASNMPVSDNNFDHDYFNDRNYARGLKVSQLVYSASDHRCCQHNHGMGWPTFVENMWQASHDHGLVAWLYGASEVTAEVGEGGVGVVVREITGYPFSSDVTLELEPARRVRFPLYLRVPRWCHGFEVRVNGHRLVAKPGPGAYVRIEREWEAGDRVAILLPMNLSLTEWPRNGSVTVDRGPLSYSVRIEEEWKPCGGLPEWPDWEVLPRSPWNYGLCVERENPATSLRTVEVQPVGRQPWTVEGAPVEIRARARRIPGWKIEDGTVQEVRTGPVWSEEPEEEIRLIPMGCAHLRMACLPVVGEQPHARAWEDCT
jgi:hypothetical protein